MEEHGAAASSKTYRKATKKLYEHMGKSPVHTNTPSDDFDAALEELSEVERKRVLTWYRRGIRRGLIFATDRVANGDIHFDEAADNLISPEEMTVRVKLRLKTGEDVLQKAFRFTAEDLGFTR